MTSTIMMHLRFKSLLEYESSYELSKTSVSAFLFQNKKKRKRARKKIKANSDNKDALRSKNLIIKLSRSLIISGEQLLEIMLVMVGVVN